MSKLKKGSKITAKGFDSIGTVLHVNQESNTSIVDFDGDIETISNDIITIISLLAQLWMLIKSIFAKRV